MNFAPTSSLPFLQLFSRAVLFFSILPVAGTALAQKPVATNVPALADTAIRGFKPTFGTDPYYIAYVGFGYTTETGDGKKHPYASRQTIGINYSPFLNSLHPFYDGQFPQAISNWDILLKAGYDGLRRMNYYGLGNNSDGDPGNVRFHWMRTRQQYGELTFKRPIATYHSLDLSLTYDGIQVLNDENRYVGKSRQTIDLADYNWQYFAGSRIRYAFNRVDNPAYPFKGTILSATAGYTESLKRGGHSFARYGTDLETYFPLGADFSFALRTGVATVSGTPDFYQYNSIGGNTTLRGYRRWRFYGKTAFYDQNELRWVRQVDLGSVNGHFGFLAFYDQGRVWLPGEDSDTMHFGYGGGIIVAPFDKLWATAALAISNTERRLHFTVNKSL